MQMLRPFVSSLLIATILSACSGPGELSAEHRQRIHSVGVSLPEPKKETIYADRSTMALTIGLGGGLVGGMAGAINMAAGESRFKPVTEPQRAVIAAMLRDKFDRALQAAGMKKGRPDAALTAKFFRYGVAHRDNQRFSAEIAGVFQLKLANGEVVFGDMMTGSSTQTFSRNEAEANPRIYRAALEEAAQDIATKLLQKLWPNASAAPAASVHSPGTNRSIDPDDTPIFN